MMEWVLNHPDVSPAYILARNGYDVWLGNNRGNRWSNQHERLNDTQEEYWDWSWEEMGTLDVPAMTKYVLNYTGFDKLTYIGHS